MQFSIFQHLRAISPSVRGGSSSPSMSGQGYVPRGRQSNTSGASTTTGSGPIKQPDGGSNGGGQTNTSAGSGTAGGRAA
ncbi:hypothetical protein EV421DRAFT_1903986 [Armillaria borealis]|uniref:Uncharacterized protein n=1 Tax=Armillaria borealis TaxID=47425 RepID=A0AA39JIH7_9AGAR|nr:hypothetical protein EV421DRAFT_1903986 [Armillaria borealis]